ncbi:hypothetical protein [Herbaspirillum rhizosphaerae]|uniref:hypothetical protein n=1 Tax=Herbaspirillum rhizosphaerae TaxID=346179 RepID=UPI0012EE090C|nr:hypothetical protein [Herbaspirillum rhizosphaerae]
MSLFFTALCRTPGAYAAQVASLLQLFPRDGRVPGAAALALLLLAAVAMAVLPAIFYWQYRNRRWWPLATGLTAFILMQDYLMRQDKGSLGETFIGATTLFGCLYLPLVALWEGNRRLARIIAGDAAALPLHASERLILVALAIPVHLFLFIVVNVLDILDARLLQRGDDVVKCLFSFAQPVNLQAYRDTLTMLLAAAPVLLLATMLAAWLRRRRSNDLAMPWQLYCAALPGVLCSGLLLASLFMR